jgi:hypothetical protein
MRAFSAATSISPASGITISATPRTTSLALPGIGPPSAVRFIVTRAEFSTSARWRSIVARVASSGIRTSTGTLHDGGTL